MKTLITIVLFITSLSVFSQNFNKLDAVCYNGTSNTYYFFSGNYYLSKKLGEPVTGPYSMSKWEGWDKLGWNSIQSAVYNEDTKTYYFFRGTEYSKKEYGQSLEAPRNTFDNWPGFPVGRVSQQAPKMGWRDGRAPNGVIYDSQRKCYFFFKGNRVALKPLGKPFTQTIPVLAAMKDKYVTIKTNDIDEDGASTIIANGAINLLEFAAFSDTDTSDKFIKDSYGTKKMVFPKFAQNWPEQWKFNNLPADQRNGMTTSYGIKVIADGLYNSDTDTWYVFVNNEATNQIEFTSWKDGKVEKNFKEIRNSGFANGWPK